MRKFLTLFAASIALVSLAACAQLPRSSEIKAGPEIKGDISGDYLYYSPSGPSSGETQQDILNGFINAGTGPQNDYEAARSYLSQDFKTKWNPNNEVLIQQGNPAISFNATGGATANVDVQATVDADGHYKVMDAGTSRILQFTMVRENGQWRISSAPNLTVLIRPVFEVIFRSYSVYFYDAQRAHLVPDLRWFPSRASTATRLVNAILKGPSDWLKPAVNSAIPAGTALSLNSVTVAQGVAAVDLTSKALTANATQRRFMKAQIRATLSQLPNVYGVNISVERGAQEILDMPDIAPSVASTQSVILQGGELQNLDSDVATSIPGTAGMVKATGATDFAISSATDLVALKGTNGVYRAHINIFGSTPNLVDARPGQLTPTFDNQGFLWTMTKKAGEAVQVVSPTGTRHTLSLGWLDSFPRRKFAISGEGSRIAILVGSGQSLHAYVASIVRDRSGLPKAFGAPIEVVGPSETPLSVSWSDENSIAVLHALNDSTVGAKTYTIGGSTRDLGYLVAARLLEARSTSSEIYALDSSGDLYAYRNISWTRVRTGVLALHFSN